MKIIKCIAVFFLCLIMGTCPNPGNIMIINIRDYEAQLAAWNNQNLLDYTLWINYVNFNDNRYSKYALCNVKNGIPVSSDPPAWISNGEMSTVPKVFAYIYDQAIKMDASYNGFYEADYDKEYHYPSIILFSSLKGHVAQDVWFIRMIPLVENEEAVWNMQNILDYELILNYSDNNTANSNKAVISVRNGTPVSSDPPAWIPNGEMSTIPEFFSFIKEEEERLIDVRTTEQGSFIAVYDPINHYPRLISTFPPIETTASIDRYCWEITMVPLELML